MDWLLVCVRLAGSWVPFSAVANQGSVDQIVTSLQGLYETKVVPCRVSYDPAEVA